MRLWFKNLFFFNVTTVTTHVCMRVHTYICVYLNERYLVSSFAEFCGLNVGQILRGLCGSFVDGSWNLCDDVMRMFHIDAVVITDRLKCHAAITLHRLVHFGSCVWVCKVWWTTGVCQILSVALTLFEPLATVKHCCKQQTFVTVRVLHSRIKNAWLAPSAHRNQMTQCSVFLDESITVLHLATCCYAEQPVYDVWL
jgi:hypothetical protein